MYKRMYLILVKAIQLVIIALQKALVEAEELCISSDEEI